MKQLTTAFLILFCILCWADVTSAQFEGEVAYDVYNPGSVAGEKANVLLAFSKDRIFVDSNISMNVMAGLRARGVLVRNELKDFVIITSDNEGLKVAKSELDNLVSMMNRVQGKAEVKHKEPFPWDERVRETGRTREMHGYSSHEFILTGDKENEYVSVWLTDNIKVDWGLLLEAWYSTGAMQFENEIPIEMIMNSNSFPLLIEVIRDNNVVYRAESISVTSPLSSADATRLPADIKLIGLTDLMMNFFRQQQR